MFRGRLTLLKVFASIGLTETDILRPKPICFIFFAALDANLSSKSLELEVTHEKIFIWKY